MKKKLLASGHNSITPFAITGEGPSFSMAERKHAVDQLIRNGVLLRRSWSQPVALPETLVLTRHAVDAGAHGLIDD